MPDPTVPLNPQLLTMRDRTSRCRAELDRLDSLVGDYDGPGRRRLEAILLLPRLALDVVDGDLEELAAGL